jgi:hypothetical protein
MMRIFLCVLAVCSMSFFPHDTFADVNAIPLHVDSGVVMENAPVIIPIGNREAPRHVYLSFGFREKAPYLALVALIGMSVMILAFRQNARTREHD